MHKNNTDVSRRHILTILSLGIMDILLRTPSYPKMQTKRTTVTSPGEEPCDESSFVVSMKPTFQAGQTYKYRSHTVKDSAPRGTGKQKTPEGKIFLEGEPFPMEQSITIADYRRRDGSTCFMVTRTAVVENPVYSDNPATAERNSEESSTSYISPAGKILSTESTLVIKEGQSTSKSTNTNSDLPPSSCLHYFFGYWMLALSSDFKWECRRTSPEGAPSLRTITVKRIEKVNNRDCYVVESVLRKKPDDIVMTTYWVDVRQRVAMQVKKGNRLLIRVL